MMFFCQKFLLLVHSYFVKIFLKCILKYIEILFSRYACLFLTTCVFQKLPFLIIYFKRHLCIFFQNMRVVPSSREVMCSCQSKKVLIISSWSLYLISVGPFKFFKRVALCALLEQVKLCNYFLHFQNILLKLFCSI